MPAARVQIPLGLLPPSASPSLSIPYPLHRISPVLTIRFSRSLRCSRSAMEPGTKLGPYEITEQLGAGGMGEPHSGS